MSAQDSPTPLWVNRLIHPLFILSPVLDNLEMEALTGISMRARFVTLSGSLLAAFTVVAASIGVGQAQERSGPKEATPLVTASIPMPRKPAVPEAKLPAKDLFAAKQLPSLGKAMAIGYYPRGCLQGGVELPPDGQNWQGVRLSRKPNWGHPEMINFLERCVPLPAKATGWKGILIGDMAQPRGGPLPYGHTSHQIGLDVDIWFMPMPDHTLVPKEREDTIATSLITADKLRVNPRTRTPADAAFISTAAVQAEVGRGFAN